MCGCDLENKFCSKHCIVVKTAKSRCSHKQQVSCINNGGMHGRQAQNSATESRRRVCAKPIAQWMETQSLHHQPLCVCPNGIIIMAVLNALDQCMTPNLHLLDKKGGILCASRQIYCAKDAAHKRSWIPHLLHNAEPPLSNHYTRTHHCKGWVDRGNGGVNTSKICLAICRVGNARPTRLISTIKGVLAMQG